MKTNQQLKETAISVFWWMHSGYVEDAVKALSALQNPESTPPLNFQQRVVAEKAELNGRATKLREFIGNNPLFNSLDSAEQERMKKQCEIMWQYSEILGQRIANFK